jgi:D-alanyl-D-alanine carboxypeptidase
LLRFFAQFAFAFVGFAALLQSAAPAGARPARHAAMILDANTGAVLHNDDADERRHPASLTKMMTLYLTFETIEQGRMAMSSKVTISQEAASVAPSKLDLDPGEEITVREAILALITKSANDVAVALAEKIGGSQRNFVRLMNAKAREFGMMRTNFENASGLPDRDQVTTARDMIALGLHLQDDYPQYYGMFATRSFSFRGRSYRNHNTLMNNFGGVDGIKTGYTRDSGFNLVTSVRRNGRHLVGAVFGGSSAAARNGEMRILLTRAFNRASRVKTRKPAPPLVAQLKAPPKRAERPAPPKPTVLAQATPKPDRPAPQPKTIVQQTPAAATSPAEDAVKPALGAQTSIARGEPAPPEGHVPSELARDETLTETAPPAATPVQVVSKVRRIMVAPRRATKATPPNLVETTDMEASDQDDDRASSADVKIAKAPAGAAQTNAPAPLVFASTSFSDAPNVTETIVPKTTPGRAPVLASAIDSRASLGASGMPPAVEQAVASNDPLAPQAAALETPSNPPSITTHAPAPAEARLPPKVITASFTPPSAPSMPEPKVEPSRARAATRPTAERAAAPIQRGMRPSTLQAQAAAISDGRQVDVAAVDPANGRFEIQIGAYASMNDAQRALGAVQARAGGVVASYASVTQPVDKGGRTIYRARFRGFDANSAANTCVALRKQSFDCFVMTAY